MTNLNDQFATPEAYVDHLNAQSPESFCTLVYGDHMGPTAQDVADYLDMASFSCWYKEVTGCRPRGYSVEQARAWMAREQANPTPSQDDEDHYTAPAEGEGWSYTGSTEGLSLEA
jgi:hypothetical protein